MSEMFEVVLLLWGLFAGGLSFMAVHVWVESGANAEEKRLRNEAVQVSLVVATVLAILGMMAFVASGCRISRDPLDRGIPHEQVPDY